MKRSRTYISGIVILLCMLVACDNGFDELNTNKVVPTSLDPAYLLNDAVVNTSYPLTTLVFEIAIVQQIVTPFGGALVGGNLNTDNRNRNSGNWQRYYRSVLKHTTEVKELTKDDPERANLYQMARIWNSFGTMILTDSYGDVPYSEAGLGYNEGLVLPKYDPQQTIYADLLKELDEASAALDSGKRIETSDVLYNGDIARWKKLGYSLLLRAAMRLSKVDPTTAESYVVKAIAGGVFESSDDNAIIRHTPQYINAIGDFLNAAEANNYYLASPFVEYMQANEDPRLESIAVRYIGAASGPDQVASRASYDPNDQIGMPIGYDNSTIGGAATADGLVSFYDYSQLDRNRMGSTTTPVFLVSYAQTQLLLAEAVVRGWTSGDAPSLFEEGIRANMEDMEVYNSGSAIDAAMIDTYIAAHPLQSGTEMEQINTQYWMASFLNGPEAFANFRRTGFPALTPNPFNGDIAPGGFIRRLTYADSELSVNAANVQEAISRQGGDKLDTRIWWDTE